MPDTSVSSFNRMMSDPERIASIKQKKGNLARELEQNKINMEKEIAALQTGTQLAISGTFEARDALDRWKTLVAHGKSQYGISGDVEEKLKVEKEAIAASKETEKLKNATSLLSKGFTPEGTLDTTNPYARMATGQANYLDAANQAIRSGVTKVIAGPMSESLPTGGVVATPRSSYQIDPEKVKQTGR